mmetsp:Transcript_17598/g.31792  ORF Transcript_17598/g.31792 Transcript_17598/m.31792 type:complete len:279 (-) Transcript_17598:163-999(-)
MGNTCRSTSKETVLQDLQKGGRHRLRLWDAPEELKGDREVVLTAVQADGLNLGAAADDCKGDREIVLAAVRCFGGALQHAADHCKSDREIVLTAAAQNWMALQFVAEHFQSDREVVLAAVKQSWLALPSAAESCRNDREIILAAVQQPGSRALSSAGESCLNDPEVVLTALQWDETAIHWVSDELLQDSSFAVEAKRKVYLLKMTMLSGRCAFVVADGFNHLSNVLNEGCHKLGVARTDGEALVLLLDGEEVPHGRCVSEWPGIRPCGEVTEVQLLVS